MAAFEYMNSCILLPYIKLFVCCLESFMEIHAFVVRNVADPVQHLSSVRISRALNAFERTRICNRRLPPRLY